MCFIGFNELFLKYRTRFDILNGRGLVRELHVYGDTTAVNASNKNGCQHTGIGGGLLRLAERKTMEQGLGGIVVISGEGVKGYYEKNGYREIDTFMVKDFSWWKVWFYYLFGQFRLYRVMVGLITSFAVVVAMLMVQGN